MIKITKVLLSFILIISPTITMACKFIPDKRPIADRQKEVKVLFEGIVTDIKEVGDLIFTTFQVTKVISGNIGQTYLSKSHGTSCEIRFVKGQKWRYAGATYMSPSELLK